MRHCPRMVWNGPCDPAVHRPVCDVSCGPRLMALNLSGILACVRCGAALPPESSWDITGTRCGGCGTEVPVVRGIPRCVGSDAYASSFSFEWNRHRLTQLDTVDRHESERTFREKTGFTPDDIKDKLVLDVGCGMGRFADVVSRWGGQVVGIDLSLAVEAAHANLAGRENVRILQADLFRLPLRQGTFDIVYSIGVLHHTPDCEKAFRQLPRFLKPGGRIAIWVYGPMGPWVKFADFYRRFTVRMPPRLLHALCRVAIPLYYLYRIPGVGRLFWNVFPASVHLSPAWRVLDTFDWYSPRYQSKHTYPEVYRWFISEGLVDIELLDFPVTVRGRRPGP
jgi:SAM-dependent methyltransferase